MTEVTKNVCGTKNVTEVTKIVCETKNVTEVTKNVTEVTKNVTEVLLWQNIDLIGLVLSFLAVIDPNSFDLVLSEWYH